jgi:hypothetical protein
MPVFSAIDETSSGLFTLFHLLSLQIALLLT